MKLDSVKFFGSEFAVLDLDTAAEIVASRGERERRFIVTPNVRILNLMRKDERYRAAIQNASMRLNDSKVTARVAALFGVELPTVTGSDLTALLFDKLAGSSHEVLVVGSNEADLDKLRERYDFPLQGIHPPMGLADKPEARRELVETLCGAQAQTILFCLGSPLGEATANEVFAARTLPGTLLCVGASIDFMTGAQRRAPLWFRDRGLEWLYRMLNDPIRLGPRYISDFFGLLAMCCSELKQRLVSR